MGKRTVVKVGLTDFKRRCLGLVADVEKGRLEKLVLTRRGRDVAELVRLRPKGGPSTAWGCMRDTILIAPGVDLTAPLDEAWDAAQA